MQKVFSTRMALLCVFWSSVVDKRQPKDLDIIYDCGVIDRGRQYEDHGVTLVCIWRYVHLSIDSHNGDLKVLVILWTIRLRQRLLCLHMHVEGTCKVQPFMYQGIGHKPSSVVEK